MPSNADDGYLTFNTCVCPEILAQCQINNGKHWPLQVLKDSMTSSHIFFMYVRVPGTCTTWYL